MDKRSDVVVPQTSVSKKQGKNNQSENWKEKGNTCMVHREKTLDQMNKKTILQLR